MMNMAELTVIYTQESDCCASGDLPQELEISIIDGGAGPYILFKTERWAMDETELSGLLARCKELTQLYEKNQDFVEKKKDNSASIGENNDGSVSMV